MERAARWCCVLALAALALTPCPMPMPVLVAAGPRYSSRIVHTDTGAIRGVIVEPASRRLEPVEVFRGVPYAAPPARLAPPEPPPRWSGTRLADTFAPVCPQPLPDISNKTAALSRMPLGVYHELKQTLPFLTNQSEDCLYLNIYVPGSGSRGVEAPYAVVAWLGAAPARAADALDGAVLAARAHLLLVTLNYRIGLLGYLTAGPSARDAVSRAGGAALLDVAAALRWTRRNIAAFGGDPARLTLAGAGDAAALANALLMLPDAKGLVSRVLLLSGSALSPSALAPDAALARDHAAQALRCTPDSSTQEHWLIECVRSRPLSALLAVEAPRARFLAGWAPSPPSPAVPGSPAASAYDTPPAPLGPTRALHASEAFLDCALAIVVTTTESYQYFNEDEIRHGFEEEHRNRILRTYVRNVYRYHRNEILAAARNEYTDWEKPIQHPINIRDATLEALSDAAAAAPALRLAQLHARRGHPTYFGHFVHQTRDLDYPQRLGSVTGDSLPYFLGLPLVGAGGAGGATGAGGVTGAGGATGTGDRSYSRGDAAVAESCVALLAAFAKTGAPAPRDHIAWPRYELNTQQYLSIGTKLRVKSHYRGHKMALWLHLVPQLHRPAPGVAARHHQLRDPRDPRPSADMFAGDIFPELYNNSPLSSASQEGAEAGAEAEAVAGAEVEAEAEEGRAREAECVSPSPQPALPALPAPRPSPREDDLTHLDTHYYSYTVALGVTVGAGCFLLALNVLVFAGIYLQRGRRLARAARPPRAARPDRLDRPDRAARPDRPERLDRHGSGCSRLSATAAMESELSAASPRKSTLKRSSEAELKERSGAAPPKKRVQIQEISV